MAFVQGARPDTENRTKAQLLEIASMANVKVSRSDSKQTIAEAITQNAK